ncbi:MAG: M16 family metallopeptidase [Candidatus Polarisedimenticolia bacterium]
MLALMAAALLSAAPCGTVAVPESGAADLRLVTCGNGVSAVVDARPGSGTVLIRVGVRVGSRDEPLELAGISHLLEHLLFKEGHGEGARRNPAFRSLREAGGLVNATTDFEMTEYHADLPAERFAQGWAALVTMVTGTAFDATDLAREREVVLQEAAMGKTDPLAIMAYSVLRQVFPDDPLGQPVIGFRSTLRRIKKEDVAAYHRRHYVPGKMFAVIVGDVDAQDAVTRVTETLGSLPASGAAEAPYPDPEPHREEAFEFRTLVSQAYLLTVALTRGERSQDAPALDLLATLLGEGRSSRLHRRLVDREGLSDQILAVSFQVSNTGAFGAGVAVDPDRAAQARMALREEMDRLAREPVSAEELSVARAVLKGRAAAQFETNAGIADFRTRRLLYGQDVSREAHEETLARLTPDDLRDTAARTWGGGSAPEPTAIEVLPARGFGKVVAALKYLFFRRL